MKIKILLSLIAFAATAALAQPAAHADGPRFIMEPNYWPKEQSVRRNTYNNLAPAALATVRSGSTPSSSSIIPMPLASIKRPPVQMQMAPVMQPNVMAQLSAPSFNSAFGKPGVLPMTANPNLISMPTQRPVVKTDKVAPSPVILSRSQNGFPKMVKRSAPVKAAPQTQIKNYPTGFESGSTAPSVSGSGMKIEQRVGGKLLPR